jgi:hypothetical protein
MKLAVVTAMSRLPSFNLKVEAEQVHPKRQELPTKLYGNISQKTVTFKY